MHPKIKELAEQAKASVPAGLLVNEWIDEYNRIFAELIVSECALVANEHVEEAEGVHLGVGRILKNHFGIDDVDAQLRNRSTYFGNNP
jgi:hypothetical protein